MKRREKGFTLIELLAVIVVLGIILAIAIPKITETIENSKNAGFINTTKVILRVARDYAQKEQLTNNSDIKYQINELPFKGKENYIGTWKWNDNKVTILSLLDNRTQKGFSNIDEENINNSTVSTFYTIENGKDGVTINDTSMPNKNYSSGFVGYKGSKKDIIIPIGITSIGNYSFYKSGLTNVIIPDSLTIIGNNAFQNNKLTSITIPDSVTFIDTSAFAYNKLTSVTIPDSLTSISGGVFYLNQLTSVTIPDSVTSIGTGAFYLNQLTSVTIPDFVTSIGMNAFIYNKLTSVKIPDSVTFIADGAFTRNPLTTIKNETGVNFNWKNILGASSCTKLTGETNDNFITGSCNYSYNTTINEIQYVGNGTVNITS